MATTAAPGAPGSPDGEEGDMLGFVIVGGIVGGIAIVMFAIVLLCCRVAIKRASPEARERAQYKLARKRQKEMMARKRAEAEAAAKDDEDDDDDAGEGAHHHHDEFDDPDTSMRASPKGAAGKRAATDMTAGGGGGGDDDAPAADGKEAKAKAAAAAVKARRRRLLAAAGQRESDSDDDPYDTTVAADFMDDVATMAAKQLLVPKGAMYEESRPRSLAKPTVVALPARLVDMHRTAPTYHPPRVLYDEREGSFKYAASDAHMHGGGAGTTPDESLVIPGGGDAYDPTTSNDVGSPMAMRASFASPSASGRRASGAGPLASRTTAAAADLERQLLGHFSGFGHDYKPNRPRAQASSPLADRQSSCRFRMADDDL